MMPGLIRTHALALCAGGRWGQAGLHKKHGVKELVLAVRVWEQQGFGSLLGCVAERRPALQLLAEKNQ